MLKSVARKKLARDGLVDYEPYAGVRLRPQGSRLALALIRRHRLIESFLVERLGMDWSEIHEEAERLEHAISDRVLERLDAFLGHPSVDPHGDPIPNAAGEVRASSTRTLAECARGDLVRVVRVLDQAGEFLKFVARKGLRPGVRIAVEDVDEAGDAIRVTMRGEGEVTLGVRAAAKLAVEEASI